MTTQENSRVLTHETKPIQKDREKKVPIGLYILLSFVFIVPFVYAWSSYRINENHTLENWHALHESQIAYVEEVWAEPVTVYPESFFVQKHYFVEDDNGKHFHIELWEKGDSFNHVKTAITPPYSETNEKLRSRMIQAIKAHDELVPTSNEQASELTPIGGFNGIIH